MGFTFTHKIVSLAFTLLLLCLFFFVFLPWHAGNPVPTTSYIGKNTAFGTMLAFQSGQGFAGNKQAEAAAGEGWKSFREGPFWEIFYSQLTGAFRRNVSLLEATGFSSNRDVAGAFAWNVVQPTADAEYDWTLPDATMTYAGEAEITISAVVYPYGAWQTTVPLNPDKCRGIDFVFFDHHGGYPADWTAYEQFLAAMVERYDGDGVDDMPGLTTRVEAWEIGNEVEGPCFASSAADYLDYLKRSFAVIKATDPQALVLNAGALETIGGTGHIVETENFWREFFTAGGAQYVDVFSVHYNAERTRLKSTPDDFTANLIFFRNLLDTFGAEDVPLWLTEFGLPNSAAYTSYVGIGNGLGVERYFLDLTSSDTGIIGASGLFTPDGRPREFLETLQSL